MISLKEPFPNGGRSRDLIETTANIFGRSGYLVSKLALEHRPEQESMAVATAQAFTLDQPLLFEAGTGVGKSLAYLIPAIVHAVDAKRQCLVSTHTISLQQQIKNKDLAICRRLFKRVADLRPYASFHYAVLVGRANYLCPLRLTRALHTRTELFHSVEQDELHRIADWAAKSKAGLIQELNPRPPDAVWQWVNADASACNRRNCTGESCFFQRARGRLHDAQVIIINHSLLFALLNTGSGAKSQRKGLLFPDDFTVLDEGHTIPAVATEQAGLRISSFGTDRLLKRLFNPRTGRGVLAIYGKQADCAMVERAIRESSEFFKAIDRDLLAQQEVARIYRAGWCEPSLNPILRELVMRLSEIARKLADEQERDELLDIGRQLTRYVYGIEDCANLEDEEKVYWAERSGRRTPIITLRTAPIDVAPYLKQRIFQCKSAVLVTSATLAQGRDIDSFAEKIGAPGVTAEQRTSPFHYERQMRIYIATDTPAPTRSDSTVHLDYLANSIAFCALRVDGGNLVLFTSYVEMHGVSERVEDQFTSAGRQFLVQGRDGSRTQLTKRFSENGSGILFGTDSFWAGVDVPGPALSQVIITRLPFEYPYHPVAEARGEWVQARGGNPFTDLSLPEAVLKLRQGVGRLIRKASDKGIVTILDSRIVTRQYGRCFIGVLPPAEIVRFNRVSRAQVFRPL